MANMTFKANLLPNTDLGYNLGSSDLKWNIYGNLIGNADTATKLGTATIGSSIKPIYLNSGTATEGEEIIPIYRSAVDFTALTPLPGAYYFDGATNPVTNASEYGTVLTLPWRKSGTSNYSSQLLISSPAGTGAPHVYVRRNTSTPALGTWSTLLDNNNYTTYTVTKTGGGASGTWGINISGTAKKLETLVLNSSTINSEAGSFMFSGSGEPWAGTDWVGLQVEGSSDKFQIHAYDGATLEYRQNDNGGTNSDGWSNWVKILSTGNYSSYLDGRYVTLTTDQNITGTKSWGTSGQGGQINGAATNGGLNSLRIGDDVWLGDCNAAGIMGMKSTSTNCGFYFYNSSGTQIGQFYSNGTNIISNKSLQLSAGNGCGIYFSGTQANYRMIRFIDNTGDNYGNGISIGGGGATIIGGGESADQAVGQVSGGSEIMYICNDGNIEFYPNLQNGWTTSYRNWIDTSGYYHGIKVYGAVWNDYAEMRCVSEDIEPGRCVKEVGDGSLILTTKRLERGCNIISDTYGFAIGETKTCKTPIAVSGRVLVYCYEGQEEAKKWIGYGVCSGPNGTVSIMTEEEERLYPNMIVGTISEIPNYDIWHAGSETNETEIQVNRRIWIKVK